MARRLRFQDQDVEIHRKRYKRSVGLTLNVDGRIAVSAPVGMKTGAIEAFLVENSAWIESHLEKYERLREAHPRKKFCKGDKFFLLGRELTLKFVPGETLSFETRASELIARGNFSSGKAHPEIHDPLIQYYKVVGVPYLRDRVEQLAQEMKLRPKSVSFRSQKTRWGSCSAEGRISLNWRLIFAPPEVIDYVIVHELAHLLHYDHSVHFWTLVSHYVSQVEEKKKWLVDHQYDADFLAARSELHPSR